MSERRCHRCGSEVHVESEGALIFCSHCGAPQVRLSEELQEQAAALRLSQEDAGTNSGAAGAALAGEPGAVVWKAALRVTAMIAGALSLLTLVLPPMALLVWIWAPLAPAVVLALYAARNQQPRLTARAGARIGMVCGLFIVTGLAVINAIQLDALRFGLHHMADFDANVNSMLAQLRAQVIAQSGQSAAGTFDLLTIPEFRAGFFLSGFAMLSAVTLMLSTAGGALAGYLRSRVPAA